MEKRRRLRERERAKKGLNAGGILKTPPGVSKGIIGPNTEAPLPVTTAFSERTHCCHKKPQKQNPRAAD
jgi:hypothetical protein